MAVAARRGASLHPSTITPQDRAIDDALRRLALLAQPTVCGKGSGAANGPSHRGSVPEAPAAAAEWVAAAFASWGRAAASAPTLGSWAVTGSAVTAPAPWLRVGSGPHRPPAASAALRTTRGAAQLANEERCCGLSSVPAGSARPDTSASASASASASSSTPTSAGPGPPSDGPSPKVLERGTCNISPLDQGHRADAPGRGMQRQGRRKRTSRTWNGTADASDAEISGEDGDDSGAPEAARAVCSQSPIPPKRHRQSRQRTSNS